MTEPRAALVTRTRGYVRTPLVERQVVDQAKAHGLPEEVAEAVAYLLGPGGRTMTGAR